MDAITPVELAERLKHNPPPVLIDVREADEFAYASIEGARHIPLRELPERLMELKPFQEQEMVVYCHHGMRSHRAMVFLAQAGFGRVSNLTGGIERWSTDVDPAVKRY